MNPQRYDYNPYRQHIFPQFNGAYVLFSDYEKLQKSIGPHALANSGASDPPQSELQRLRESFDTIRYDYAIQYEQSRIMAKIIGGIDYDAMTDTYRIPRMYIETIPEPVRTSVKALLDHVVHARELERYGRSKEGSDGE